MKAEILLKIQGELGALRGSREHQATHSLQPEGLWGSEVSLGSRSKGRNQTRGEKVKTHERELSQAERGSENWNMNHSFT